MTGENWWVTVMSGRLSLMKPVNSSANSTSDLSLKRWKPTHSGESQSITSGKSLPYLLLHASQQQIVGQKVMSMNIPSIGYSSISASWDL